MALDTVLESDGINLYAEWVLWLELEVTLLSMTWSVELAYFVFCRLAFDLSLAAAFEIFPDIFLACVFNALAFMHIILVAILLCVVRWKSFVLYLIVKSFCLLLVGGSFEA